MQDLMVIFFNSIFVNNIVLAQFLGICSFLGVSRNLKTAMGMSQAVIFVLVAASAITFPIQYYILNPNNMGYMQTLIFILVIAALVQIIEAILKKSMKGLYKALGIYLPLITMGLGCRLPKRLRKNMVAILMFFGKMEKLVLRSIYC